MKIGILGGTFNPIHWGHLEMAVKAKEAFQLDEILFMPNYLPPHKDRPETTLAHRTHMLQLALTPYKDFQWSSLEIEKKGISYTFETLEEITRIYPHDVFYFIIGEDSYVNFFRWKNPERILSLVKLIVFQRKGLAVLDAKDTDALIQQEKATVHFLKEEIMEVSSSSIRQRIEEGAPWSHLVPDSVAQFIKEHHLYETSPWSMAKLREELHKRLSPKRVPHVLGVEKLAMALAQKYGEDPKEAQEAALYHDLLKEWSTKDLIAYIKAHGEDPGEGVNAPQILHAQAGAIFAQVTGGVTSHEVLMAIRYHTTGRSAMSTLEKIVYLADLAEEGRHYEGVDTLRHLLQVNLDEAMLFSLEGTKRVLKDRGLKPTGTLQEAMAYYHAALEGKKKHDE